MRFHIEHITRYCYSRPVFLEPHTVRLRPRGDVSQTLNHYHLTIMPKPSGLSQGLDMENNGFTLLWFEGVHEALEIHVRMEIDTWTGNPFAGLLLHGAERLPLSVPKDQADADFWEPYLSLASWAGRRDRHLFPRKVWY